MDGNKTNYFLLRQEEEFSHRATRMLWSRRHKALVLAQTQQLRLPNITTAEALLAWENAVPLVLDRFGQQGRISASGNRLEYNAGHGFHPLVDSNLRPVRPPEGRFTDIHLGGDDRLVAGFSNDTDRHGLLVFQLNRRILYTLDLPEQPVRVLVDKDNTIWALTAGQLLCCRGEPLPHDYLPRPDRFEPMEINPHPLRIVEQIPLDVADVPLAMCFDSSRLYLLIHRDSGQLILTRDLHGPDAALIRCRLPQSCPFAVDIGVADAGHLVLMIPREPGDSAFQQRDCCPVRLPEESTSGPREALIVRERYPMLSQASPRFVGSADQRLRYQAEVQAESPEHAAGYTARPRELLPLHRPQFHTVARATLNKPLDSGQPETIWHRLYLEGCIPSGCSVILYAKAYNNPEDRTRTPYIRQPDLIRSSLPSEQPFGKGQVREQSAEKGLFELLLQRAGGPVRRLSGRYLQLRLILTGDGRRSPAVHALKIYFPRFSYQEAYLPEHFRQEESVDPARDSEPANGADFRERMLAALEGIWTPLEGQVAAAEILLNPEQTPEKHLPWLAELLGCPLPDHWPLARKRRWLKETGALQRSRGTAAGLNLALDIVTDGAVSRGQVIVVEHFRLRRTMATILGVLMDDRDHPLTLGTGMNGNSLVGERLILSEAEGREFLALLAPELADRKDTDIVEEFFFRYANRVTILLHGPARALEQTVRSIAREQIPAHLDWRIVPTDHPFVPGLAPLLTVDTFLEETLAPEPVVLDKTTLGRQAMLYNPGALSPRDVNAPMRPE